MKVSVNCWVLGDTVDSTFVVRVDLEDTIFDIKQQIQVVLRPRFDNISATDLNLWEVDSEEQELANFVPHAPVLRAIRKVKTLGLEHEDHVHVIVNSKPPVEGLQPVVNPGPELLWLNCYTLGLGTIFTVKIPAQKNVSSLKTQIKEANSNSAFFGDVDAQNLKLWHVNFSVDNLSSINRPTDSELRNTTLLSKLFEQVLNSELVHVVVEVHPESPLITKEGRFSHTALGRTFQKNCNDISKALAPSASAKSLNYPKSQRAYSIHDGRYQADQPRSSVGPPIELFHPAFGHFLDGIRCSHGCIPKDIIRSTTDYMQATSANYGDERSRRNKLTPILGRVLGFTLQLVENNDGTKADGILELFTLQHGFLILLKEDKNEFGNGASDPSTQAGLSAARAWVQSRQERFRNATACPTFLIANAGPWLAVLGFAFTDCVIVQRLTDFIWVGIDSPLSRSHVNRVARIFYVLKTSLHKLKSYYNTLTINSAQIAPTRYFPSITAYPVNQNQRVQFEYLGYLEDGFECVTLHARTYAQPRQDIVVKFVESYSERAHQILAEEGWAPQLLYYGSLQFDHEQPSYDTLFMVVMEYIDGDTFALAKSKISEDMCKSELRNALGVLHGKGLVFGDLRPPNVMITKENKVKLIDFDWAGTAGQVQYPHLLSSSVQWPKDVKPLDLIKVEHDLEMLEKLFAM